MDYAKPAVKVFVSQVLSAPSFKDGRIYHKLGNFVFQRVWLQVGVVVPQCPCRSGVRRDFFGLPTRFPICYLHHICMWQGVLVQGAVESELILDDGSGTVIIEPSQCSNVPPLGMLQQAHPWLR